MPLDNWEYQNEPGFSDDLLKQRAEQVLRFLLQLKARDLALFVQDTRRMHRFYFQGLTPTGAPYFAGNYRGSNFPGLKEYRVSFGGMNGTLPQYVDIQMSALADNVRELVERYELIWADSQRSSAEKLYRLAELVAAVFVVFLTIHPYANGNGHISRYIAVALFTMYGFRPHKMPIHPRPNIAPSLGDLLQWYRASKRSPLIAYFLSTLQLQL